VKLRWDWVAAAYLVLALVGAALSMLLNGANPFLHPTPKLALGPVERHALSALLGLVLGAFVVATSRLTVSHWMWARRLHGELRPVAVGMGSWTIVMVALLSSLGEEMVFRSLLTPIVGVGVQALLFGLLHQMRGKSRWIWVAWAACMGLALGGLYWVTGSLAGPIVSHAVINALNLLYLRDHSLRTPDGPMGGLLAGSGSQQAGGNAWPRS
jgi:membrane protease YdiL (CAAX protease family)